MNISQHSFFLGEYLALIDSWRLIDVISPLRHPLSDVHEYLITLSKCARLS